MATISPAVQAANALTGTLLALLASAADETARAELAAALGRTADTAVQDALELIDVLREGESTTAAFKI